MKKQILVIGGGETFETYDDYLEYLKLYEMNIDRVKAKRWKNELQDVLGDEWEVIFPVMPSARNAKYLEWKIWFEKFIPYLRDDVILLGHSLGGTFLVKYLSENEFPLKISAAFLIAPPFDDKDRITEHSLADFILSGSLGKFENQCEKIYVYFSKDDPVIPFADLSKYEKAFPDAEKVVFEDKGHFNQEEFPELVEKIKNSF
ncbi:alpha/beta hydrolase [Patescibacteria group bacterium]